MTCNVRCGTMDRFKQRSIFTNVGRWNQTKSSNKSSPFVRQYVSEKVCGYNHLKAFRLCNQVHCSCINVKVLGCNVRIILCNFIENFFKQSVCLFQHIGLMNCGNFTLVVVLCIFECIVYYAFFSFTSDDTSCYRPFIGI